MDLPIILLGLLFFVTTWWWILSLAGKTSLVLAQVRDRLQELRDRLDDLETADPELAHAARKELAHLNEMADEIEAKADRVRDALKPRSKPLPGFSIEAD